MPPQKSEVLLFLQFTSHAFVMYTHQHTASAGFLKLHVWGKIHLQLLCISCNELPWSLWFRVYTATRFMAVCSVEWIAGIYFNQCPFWWTFRVIIYYFAIIYS